MPPNCSLTERASVHGALGSPSPLLPPRAWPTPVASASEPLFGLPRGVKLHRGDHVEPGIVLDKEVNLSW